MEEVLMQGELIAKIESILEELKSGDFSKIKIKESCTVVTDWTATGPVRRCTTMEGLVITYKH
jgi:hypothetical protein